MNKREKMKKVAEETLTTISKGYYTINEKVIQIREVIDYSLQNTELISPENGEQYLAKSDSIIKNYENDIEVTNESTLVAAKRLSSQNEKVLVLNFASAKNPGGGFLKGSSAQEESLARSSALYTTLISKEEMYNVNKKANSCMYSDYMIYSPSVPVFKDNNGNLLQEPFVASFISAPAVNAGVVREREKKFSQKDIDAVMEQRISKILAISAIKGYEHLVLGAYGCGVFKNSPIKVANYFKKLLNEEKHFKNTFKSITFAILDFSEEKQTFKTFEKVLK